MIVRKPYAGLAEEFTFTIFERVRAGLNMPSIFGASNASRDQVKNFEQLNEYNKRVGVEERVNLDHVVHSLGASSSQNSFSWAKSQGLTFDHLTFNGYGAGPSYPMQSNSLVNKLTLGRVEKSYVDSATELFGKGQVSYTAAPADVVATGIGLPWVAGRYGIGIGNSDSTSEKKWYIPIIDMVKGDHTTIYTRDERAADFLLRYGENLEEINSYHQDRWGSFEPKTKTIQFNNHKVENQ
ncbi:hypothetical protein EV697_10820 [Bisgaardia hudsonensis]|uniref:Filamentous hemagglutinin n=1 Tax=Bisgaardia hudsonensis TaxID=109472 RepID=A0A4R2MSV8_9PAST|nr:hypothetical protein [Bisgaardia hudsonensis]QLB12883.1 hypothetical protein A6A11_04300 [Bisgaardia hudsonensis]TCP11297.1 hypothetical protein EV697_10820 [Bisgaardia hudsonensis]